LTKNILLKVLTIIILSLHLQKNKLIMKTIIGQAATGDFFYKRDKLTAKL